MLVMRLGQERPINILPAPPIRQLAGPLVRCRNAPDWISSQIERGFPSAS